MIEVEVWDDEHTASILLEPKVDTVDLTCWTHEQETTVTLDLRGVRQLRLALQRFEKKGLSSHGN